MRSCPKQVPVYKPIISDLVQAIGFWRVFPSKPVSDHVGDPANYALSINPLHAMRQREVRRNSRQLTLAQQE